jgi:hypothetical protein
MARGGPRPGAGRPPANTVEHRVRLPRDVAAWLREYGGGRISRGIVRLVQDFLEKKV